jgi:hypothetical protein
MVDGGTKTTASIGPMTYSNGMPSLWFNESIKNGDMLSGMIVRMDGDSNYGAIEFRQTPDNVTYTTNTAIKILLQCQLVPF